MGGPAHAIRLGRLFPDTYGPGCVGRDFNERDDKGTPQVALVNERFAKRYFEGRNPIGLHVGMGGNPGTKTDIEIVGVVKDTRYESLRDEVPY